MKKSNAEKTAPIFLQLYKYRNQLSYKDELNRPFAKSYCVEEFVNTFYPSNIENNYEALYKEWFLDNNYNILSTGNRDNFGRRLDPGNRLAKLLLNQFPTDRKWCPGGDFYHEGKDHGHISDVERGLAFALLKYSFGDNEAKKIFNELELTKSYYAVLDILNKVYFMSDDAVQESVRTVTYDFFGNSIIERHTEIQSKYTGGHTLKNI